MATNDENSQTEQPNRRTFLKKVALGASLAALGGSIVWQSSGYTLADSVAKQLKCLNAKQYLVLQAAAQRILAIDSAPAPKAKELNVTLWCDAYLARQPDWAQEDFGLLLFALEHSPPLLEFQFSRFSKATPTQQDQVLESWATSRLELRKQGFHALKGLCMLAYYRSPKTWDLLGYDGPLIR